MANLKNNTLASSATAAQTLNKTISYSGIIGIYAIIPLSFLAYLLDKFYLNSYLFESLPTSPENYFWFAMFFGTPHIVASNVILLTNADYLKTYWRRLVFITLAIIAFFAIGNELLSYNVLFSIVATTTVIHVIKQQIGIGNSAARLSGWLFTTWSWTTIALGIVLYNGIYLRRVFSEEQVTLINIIMVCLSMFVIILTILCDRRITNKKGRIFLWINALMALSSFFFYSEKYYFFAILCPRLIHDLTAFYVYCVHDHNRHSQSPKNYLYRFFNTLSMPALVVVPLVAVGLTYVMHTYADQAFNALTERLFDIKIRGAISFMFVGYLSLLHYYTESFTWKSPSAYKKFIAFR